MDVMSLNYYKDKTMHTVHEKKWNGPTLEQIWMFFIEEVGELAGSIRRTKNLFRDKKIPKIESELGDVFSYLFQLSHMLNIDLDIMWENHQRKMNKKKYLNDVNSKIIFHN